MVKDYVELHKIGVKNHVPKTQGKGQQQLCFIKISNLGSCLFEYFSIHADSNIPAWLEKQAFFCIYHY